MLRIYQVDAFHSQVLHGNPAAVIPLDQWLPNEQLLAIAIENNLSETAYLLPEEDGQIPIRWFTPGGEVRLCGHATLATAHVLFQEIGLTQKTIQFSSLSGTLTVQHQGENRYELDFPADNGQLITVPSIISQALDKVRVMQCVQGRDDLMVILDQQQIVAQLQPDFSLIKTLDYRGLIVTAPSNEKEVDFVSRCFYPRYGINEDPVTGSAHTLMTPYWAKRLGKDHLEARQISAREGILRCELRGDRVGLVGRAVTYMRGYIYL